MSHPFSFSTEGVWSSSTYGLGHKKKKKKKKKKRKKPIITTTKTNLFYRRMNLPSRVGQSGLFFSCFVSGDRKNTTRRFSNHESCLLSRSHTFAIIVILDLKIHHSMWIHWPFFPKTWTKGHWPLDDLWPHACWGHMCDSTQESLCPSPMTIHQCMWIVDTVINFANRKYHIHTHTYYVHTTYYVHNEWSHSLLLNSVQARQKCLKQSDFFIF